MASSCGEVVATSVQHGGVAGLVDDGRRDEGHAVDARELVAHRVGGAEQASPPELPWTVSTIGAEKPGPNPSASRS